MESGDRLYIGQIIGHDDDISWSCLLRDPWSASTGVGVGVGVGASQSPSAITMVMIRSADPPLGCQRGEGYLAHAHDIGVSVSHAGILCNIITLLL